MNSVIFKEFPLNQNYNGDSNHFLENIEKIWLEKEEKDVVIYRYFDYFY